MPTLSAIPPWPRRTWQAAERALDAMGGAAGNPLRHLGALGCLLFAWLVGSGVFLFAVLDTSASGAWQSIESLSHGAWGLGSVPRSMHRYAADAFVWVVFAHLLRELVFGHFSGFRRFSWLTGVPLPLLAMVCAIGGFWLHWDELGQYSALATAELLDALPIFASPLTRNFLHEGAVSDRLFSLFIFVHLGVPLLLLFGLWFHVQRIAHVAFMPPRPLARGASLSLLVVALAAPVVSHAPADLSRVPQMLRLDWWLLFVHPLTDATSPYVVWGFVAALLLALFALPWLRRVPPAPVAQVNPAHCSGCARCEADCPYAAITMVPHTSGRPGKSMALVDADLCASCGICAGACPSSTPFRGVAVLTTGIDMPQQPVDTLRTQIIQGLAAMPTDHRVLVVGCDQGARVQSLAGPHVLPMSLLCTGLLPPSFIEYALRGGADAVMVASCRAGGCEFRLGPRWADERLSGAREPHLRGAVPRERVVRVEADAGEEAVLLLALQSLLGPTRNSRHPANEQHDHD